ncbi:MAG: hypothetical protein CVU61_06250 [Deltaproteobacteria bacterium HGW-Deltaproteobacteria-19]|nr:MAG: hypothetical protein CVU61_06250 [Deltaproteobacteria bacterium HGW-Deltaproteobacteria-19]
MNLFTGSIGSAFFIFVGVVAVAFALRHIYGVITVAFTFRRIYGNNLTYKLFAWILPGLIMILSLAFIWVKLDSFNNLLMVAFALPVGSALLFFQLYCCSKVSDHEAEKIGKASDSAERKGIRFELRQRP